MQTINVDLNTLQLFKQKVLYRVQPKLCHKTRVPDFTKYAPNMEIKDHCCSKL